MIHHGILETLVLTELRNIRRYAYCLIGDRDSCDEIVERVLEKLVGDSVAGSGTISRLDLYRHVNDRINAQITFAKPAVADSGSLQARLCLLPLHKRQIIVLSSVIGFPMGDVAAIMGLPVAVVARAQLDALCSLQTMPMSVLIVEDEALIARELSRIVASVGLPVAGMAKNRSEALRIAGASHPRIVLADYQLRNGETGVEVVRSIREQGDDAKVIYITAHPEAVRADNSRDLVIPKPFHPRTIERALERLTA